MSMDKRWLVISMMGALYLLGNLWIRLGRVLENIERQAWTCVPKIYYNVADMLDGEYQGIATMFKSTTAYWILWRLFNLTWADAWQNHSSLNGYRSSILLYRKAHHRSPACRNAHPYLPSLSPVIVTRLWCHSQILWAHEKEPTGKQKHFSMTSWVWRAIRGGVIECRPAELGCFLPWFIKLPLRNCISWRRNQLPQT